MGRVGRAKALAKGVRFNKNRQGAVDRGLALILPSVPYAIESSPPQEASMPFPDDEIPALIMFHIAADAYALMLNLFERPPCLGAIIRSPFCEGIG